MITRAEVEKAYQESGLTGLIIDGPFEKFINLIAAAAYKHALGAPEIDAAVKRAYERAITETAGAFVKEAIDRIECMAETGMRLPLNMECVAQVFGGKLHWAAAAPVLADGTKLYAFRKP